MDEVEESGPEVVITPTALLAVARVRDDVGASIIACHGVRSAHQKPIAACTASEEQRLDGAGSAPLTNRYDRAAVRTASSSPLSILVAAFSRLSNTFPFPRGPILSSFPALLFSAPN
ncbi:hypothetical protein Tcan_18727 [Toxocara canis]|uniref:Uncharacterized protein n=2 Tax=Toxocara canis TaxID=6265 RepID=A0A0B2W2E1_TOXCA|nr:hypothetical protein Tcan_18727 [Toxocara canis]VDM42433.1 unnamed protein product [Toxocara canis]